MPASLSRRLFLSLGASLASADLLAFPWPVRPPGSLVPLGAPTELPLPAGAIRRLGTGRARMRESIRGFRTHPGSSLAVTASSKEIWFWDAARGVVLGRFQFPEEIDPAEGRITDHGTLLVLGRIGKGDSNSISEFRIPGGELLRRSYPERTVNHEALTFSADGRSMLVARRGEVSLFDLGDGKKQWNVAVSNMPLLGLEFVPGQPWVTAVTGREVRLLHEADGKTVATLEARPVKANAAKDEELINSLHVSPKGDWLAVAVGEDDETRLVAWELPARKERFSVPFQGSIEHVHEDGKSLLARNDRFLKTVEMTGGKVIRTVAVPRATEIGVIRHGKTIVYDAGDTLTRVDADTGRDQPGNPMPPDRIADLRFRDTHRLVGRLATWGGWVEWDLRTGDAKLIRPAAALGMTPIAMTHDQQQFVYRSEEGHFRFRSDGTATGKSAPLKKKDRTFDRTDLSASDPEATVVTYIADDQWLCHDFKTGANRVLRKGITTKMVRDHVATSGPFVAFSTIDGGTNSDLLEIWDIRTGERKRSLDGLGHVEYPALNPDGSLVAFVIPNRIPVTQKGETRPDHVVALHSVETGIELVRIEVSGGDAFTAFSPDGRSMVCRYRKVAEIWDLHGGGRRQSLTVPEATAMAFSPDGRFLAMACVGAPVFLWDLHAPVGKAPPPDEPALIRAWEELASRDCKAAFEAIKFLTANPTQALPILKARLPLATGPELEKLKTLFADLNHDQFRKREFASRELAALGASVQAQAREELRRAKSAEHQARLERLLSVNHQKSTRELQASRAVEISESIASPNADALLTHWSGGFAGAILTREAKSALTRRQVVVGK